MRKILHSINNFEDLPQEIAIFPLRDVLLLPRGNLPLNIFEDRYLNMIDDAMAGNRIIGIIQMRQCAGETGGDDDPLYDVGCIGRINNFEETDDGRYLINLRGLCRFSVGEELSLCNGYRRINPLWDAYKDDVSEPACLDLDRERLKNLLAQYFTRHEIACDWDQFDGVPDDKLMTCLSMACPLDAPEKQALLEAGNCAERAQLFLTMLEMAIHLTEKNNDNDESAAHH